MHVTSMHHYDIALPKLLHYTALWRLQESNRKGLVLSNFATPKAWPICDSEHQITFAVS